MLSEPRNNKDTELIWFSMIAATFGFCMGFIVAAVIWGL